MNSEAHEPPSSSRIADSICRFLTGIDPVFLLRSLLPRHGSAAPVPPGLPDSVPDPPLDLKTDADGSEYDYVNDDPSLPEQPDDGSQEPDDTTDEYFYPEGVNYYVTAADDLE
ncbi:hypothetical protein VPH35_082432 [Triticum aestivum]|uniref:uncharacterized protein n=1 Tax=Triticum aestivum TaxID=4565 RepID=UPI001D028166|nr:uncharacterized protein LOC123106819 [Triticum aestivum]